MSQLTLSRLGPADHAALARLLEGDPVATAYMRSELRLSPALFSWWGLGCDGELRAACMGGPLVVPWVPAAADAQVLAEALRQHQSPPRLLVGPAPSVRGLAAALGPERQPTQVRDPQPLLALDRPPPVPPGVRVRRGQRSDLEPLTLAAAAMHREEMGVDPMEVDAAGWRMRMTTLVDRGWSFVWREGAEIIFKVELSAWTPDVVQLQGVWTNPRWRRRGIAGAGLAMVCAELLRDVPVCSLYANAYNLVAMRLYERLGFAQVGEFATIIY